MLSKNVFTIIYVAGVIWFFAAGIYTYKVVLKEYFQIFKSNKDEM